MGNRYDQGDLVRVIGTWTDPLNSDTPIDPTAVNLSVKTPAGVVTTYVYGVDGEVVKSSTGVYYSDISLSEGGTWTYRWWSTGTRQAAEEEVLRSEEAVAV